MTLRKVCDIAALLTNGREIDWHQLKERAKQMGAERIVVFGVTLASSIFDIHPLGKAQWIEAPTFAVQHLIEQTKERLTRGGPPSLDVLERLLFHFKVHTGWRSRLAQLHLLPMKIDDQLRRFAIR